MLAYTDSGEHPTGQPDRDGTPRLPTIRAWHPHPARTAIHPERQSYRHGYRYRYVSGQQPTLPAATAGTAHLHASRAPAPQPTRSPGPSTCSGPAGPTSPEASTYRDSRAGGSTWNSSVSVSAASPTHRLARLSRVRTRARALPSSYGAPNRQRRLGRLHRGTRKPIRTPTEIPTGEWNPDSRPPRSTWISTSVPSSATAEPVGAVAAGTLIWARATPAPAADTSHSNDRHVRPQRTSTPISWQDAAVATSARLSSRKLQEYDTAPMPPISRPILARLDATSHGHLSRHRPAVGRAAAFSDRASSPTRTRSRPNGGAIERHLIFMTDGDAHDVVDNNLCAYGSAWWDRRQIDHRRRPRATLDTIGQRPARGDVHRGSRI